MILGKLATLWVKEKPALACFMLESVQEAMQSELGASNEDGIVRTCVIGEWGTCGESPWREMMYGRCAYRTRMKRYGLKGQP